MHTSMTLGFGSSSFLVQLWKESEDSLDGLAVGVVAIAQDSCKQVRLRHVWKCAGLGEGL